MRSLAFILALLLAGCGLLPELKDETAGWSANRLYSAAKEAMGDGSYDKAVKYFEILESRYPYGRYAQQAQIEIAYAYYKASEPASPSPPATASSSCTRTIPTSITCIT
jgi:outer membrane protein assembly factor BamD